MDIVDHGTQLARAKGPFVAVHYIMRHRVGGIVPDEVETMHLEELFGIGLIDGGVVFQLGFKVVVAMVEGIETGLGFRAFHQDGIGVLGIAFEGHVLLVGEEEERTAPALEHEGLHLVVGAHRGVEHRLPVVDDGRVDGLSQLLEIYGLTVGVGEVHVDVIGGLTVASGQHDDGGTKE